MVLTPKVTGKRGKKTLFFLYDHLLILKLIWLIGPTYNHKENNTNMLKTHDRKVLDRIITFIYVSRNI